MGLGIQPWLARVTFGLNSRAVRHFEQRHHILVVAYHRVGNAEQLWPDPADMAEATVEQFEAQMDWIGQYCTPISLEQTLQVAHGKDVFPNRAVLVTFDDGYREDLQRTLPSLRRNGIRPVVFLPSAYVGTRLRFWWDRVGVCVQTTTRDHLLLPEAGMMNLPLDTTPGNGHPNNPIFFGGGNSWFNNFATEYSGLIDDVQIYDQALSDAEVEHLYQYPGESIPDPVVNPATISPGDVIHVDIDGGSQYTGPGADGTSGTWNTGSFSGTALSKSDGSASPVAYAAGNWDGFWSTALTGHPVLEDFLFDRTPDPIDSTLTITGLDDSQQYDLYIYTGVEGGIY